MKLRGLYGGGLYLWNMEERYQQMVVETSQGEKRADSTVPHSQFCLAWVKTMYLYLDRIGASTELPFVLPKDGFDS